MRIIPEWKGRDQEIRQLWDRYHNIVKEGLNDSSGTSTSKQPLDQSSSSPSCEFKEIYLTSFIIWQIGIICDIQFIFVPNIMQ